LEKTFGLDEDKFVGFVVIDNDDEAILLFFRKKEKYGRATSQSKEWD